MAETIIFFGGLALIIAAIVPAIVMACTDVSPPRKARDADLYR